MASTFIVSCDKPISPIPLDAISCAPLTAPITVSSALLFDGKIDVQRFLGALEKAVEHCPWLACALDDKDGRISVVARSEQPAHAARPYAHGYLTCEVEEREEYSSSIPVAAFLPDDIHIKMVRVDLAFESLQGLPMAAFKVTQCKDHFILGYRLNHIFFDQSSIVYLFTFLASIYSSCPQTQALPSPVFQPRSCLVLADAVLSAEDFQHASPRQYKSLPAAPMEFGIPLSVKLSLNAAAVSELRGERRLSSNDFLHAILLKAMAKHLSHQCSDADADTQMQVLFARNMRVPFALPPTVTGDYVRLESLSGSLQHVMDANIVSLAEESRRVVSSDEGRRRFPKECQWLLDYHKHHEGAPHVNFADSKPTVIVTNWSTFPYESISFDGCTPSEVLLEGAQAMSGILGFVTVSFQGKGDQRRIVAVFTTVYQPVADCLKEFAEHCPLISVI